MSVKGGILQNEKYAAMKQACARAMKPYVDDMSAMEVLAILSQMVGVAVAMQDQRAYTPQQVMAVVANNIEIGNMQCIADLLGPTNDTAH